MLPSFSFDHRALSHEGGYLADLLSINYKETIMHWVETAMASVFRKLLILYTF